MAVHEMKWRAASRNGRASAGFVTFQRQITFFQRAERVINTLCTLVLLDEIIAKREESLHCGLS